MNSITQTSGHLRNTKPASLDHAKQLAAKLLSERGEASGALVSRELNDVLRALDGNDRHGFQRYLATTFQPDTNALRAAAERYLADTTAETAAAVARAADPPRQELLRRMNMAPGGTGALIAMRREITAHLREEPELRLLDADLKHLLASWFNRGFLELRRIDWQSPAAVLEKLIAYEAVHEIKGWDDLRRRLAPDRRCFAFFHPALPGEPLIFVEVALVQGLATSMPPLLSQDGDEDAARVQAANADTAIFYSISNCQEGLRGVSFGNFLIKQVAEDLGREFPRVKTFATLSPIPGLRKWLAGNPAVAEAGLAPTLALLNEPDWTHKETVLERLQPALMKLCAWYLLHAKSGSEPEDSVARFHLGNGARMERLNWLGDTSKQGMARSAGLMVNYVYRLDEVEQNHEAYVKERQVVASARFAALARECPLQAKKAKPA
jgi:malonyl-CoA decarboxylase